MAVAALLHGSRKWVGLDLTRWFMNEETEVITSVVLFVLQYEYQEAALTGSMCQAEGR